MKTLSGTSSGEVSNSRIFAAASARDARSILGAAAIASVWAFLFVAMITGVMRPLGDSFAAAASDDRIAVENLVSDPPDKPAPVEEPLPASRWTTRGSPTSGTCVE
jgi:predicted metal-binding membrane protein